MKGLELVWMEGWGRVGLKFQGLGYDRRRDETWMEGGSGSSDHVRI